MAKWVYPRARDAAAPSWTVMATSLSVLRPVCLCLAEVLRPVSTAFPTTSAHCSVGAYDPEQPFKDRFALRFISFLPHRSRTSCPYRPRRPALRAFPQRVCPLGWPPGHALEDTGHGASVRFGSVCRVCVAKVASYGDELEPTFHLLGACDAQCPFIALTDNRGSPDYPEAFRGR